MVKCQLKCKNGKLFQVDVDELKKAGEIKKMVEDAQQKASATYPNAEAEEAVVDLPLTEKCMEKLLVWCRYHKDDEDQPPPDSEDGFNYNDELTEWDLQFLKMDDKTLFDLIHASDIYKMKPLLDITTTYVARIMADLRTPEKIRRRFNIRNDLTEEDLKQIDEEAEHWLEDPEEMEQLQQQQQQAAAEAAGDSAEAGTSGEASGGYTGEHMEESEGDYDSDAASSEGEGPRKEEMELLGAVGGSDKD